MNPQVEGGRPLPVRLLFIVLFGLAILPPTATAFAHGRTEAGDYVIEVGFLNEPAYQGEPNGLDLIVTQKVSTSTTSTLTADGTATPSDADHSADEATPDSHDHASADEADRDEEGPGVGGLEDTLQAEVIYGKNQKTLAIEPQPGKPGAYTVALIPTAAGDYTWHIFGTIEDQAVDVSLTSGPGSFDNVEAKEAVSFPEDGASTPDLAGQIGTLESRVSSLATATRTASAVGGLGVLLGLVALIYSIFGARRPVG